MGFTSCFAGPFKSLSADLLYKDEQTRKRKRESVPLPAEVHGQIRSQGSSVNEPSDFTAPRVLPLPFVKPPPQPISAEVREVQSGDPKQISHLSLPEGKFPHAYPLHFESLAASVSNSKQAVEPNAFSYATTPRNAGASGENGRYGLRCQHTAAIIAIMHRCILEGDYSHARRAWAMLLRAEKGGHSVDLRTNDRWGVGAELLLHPKHKYRPNIATATTLPIPNHSLFEQHNDFRASTLQLDLSAFEQIKNYYERLALQYPYQKPTPETTGPSDFYIAMLGIWISSIQERHTKRLVESEDGLPNKPDASRASHNNARHIAASEPRLRQYRRQKEAKGKVLQQAREVLARLKEYLLSPPYSDCSTYWELQGMVELWINDLVQVNIPARSEAVSVADTGDPASLEENTPIDASEVSLTTNQTLISKMGKTEPS